MSKKKRQQRAEETQVIKQETLTQDDPYWKVSGIYMDPHRVGRFVSRFERFEDRHPEWTDDLMYGMPTYYGVLGVEKGATKDQIGQAYERKLKFSSYPGEVIEEAFKVLSNPGLRKEYDELLFTFEQITKCMPYPEKNELIKKHSASISIEREYIRMGQILSKYTDYTLLYIHGMPDLYEIAGLAKDSTAEKIRRNCRADTELLKKICTILGDPASREEYDFILGFITKHTDTERLEERERSSKKWKHIDRDIFERIILIALNEPGIIEKYMQRLVDIHNSNQDWKQYLPPGKDTFLSILGLDAGSFRADKKEVERAIREKYRQLEKTPQVNLAYSVLKNTSQREDYLWLLENHKMLDTLASLFSVKGVPREIKKEKEEIPDIQEMMDMLTSIFEEEEVAEEEAPKKIKKRKNKM